MEGRGSSSSSEIIVLVLFEDGVLDQPCAASVVLVSLLYQLAPTQSINNRRSSCLLRPHAPRATQTIHSPGLIEPGAPRDPRPSSQPRAGRMSEDADRTTPRPAHGIDLVVATVSYIGARNAQHDP
jgi:hypothetical protein